MGPQCVVTPMRLSVVCYGDTVTQTFVLDVHDSVEVGCLELLTNFTQRRVKWCKRERVVVTCDIDKPEVVVLLKLGNNLSHFVVVVLRKENHLYGTYNVVVLTNYIALQCVVREKGVERGEYMAT